MIPKQTHTIAKTKTVVLANIDAPIKQMIKFTRFKIVQYKNCHHLPSFTIFFTKYPKKHNQWNVNLFSWLVKVKEQHGVLFSLQKFIPDGPKLSINPSTQPEMHRPLLTILAKKNKVPIEPPNSGPKVRLIITERLSRTIFKKVFTSH